MAADHRQGNISHSLDDMAILNVFIKTIFEPQARFSGKEQQVLQALRGAEQRLSRASVFDLGDHLRDLSTDGMKTTVEDVRQHLDLP